MLPKILRMRLDAIERFSLARAVLVAMEMCLAFSCTPAKAGAQFRAPRRGPSSPLEPGIHRETAAEGAEDAKSRARIGKTERKVFSRPDT